MENIRITLENGDSEQFYCILEKSTDYTEQFETAAMERAA